jgi:hypothetical protein
MGPEAWLSTAGGIITLGEMRAKGMVMLGVACRRCERRGRPADRAADRRAWVGVLDLGAIIAVDCPRIRNPSTSIYERCGGTSQGAALVLSTK